MISILLWSQVQSVDDLQSSPTHPSGPHASTEPEDFGSMTRESFFPITNLEPDIEPNVEPNVEPDIEAGVEPDVETDVRPNINLLVNPK